MANPTLGPPLTPHSRRAGGVKIPFGRNEESHRLICSCQHSAASVCRGAQKYWGWLGGRVGEDPPRRTHRPSTRTDRNPENGFPMRNL